MGVTLVYDIANDLLDVGVKILRDGGRDPVQRRFVNIGAVLAPINFGEGVSQLTVSCGPIGPDLVTDVLQRREGKLEAGQLPKVKFEVALIRSAVIKGASARALPTPEKLDAEAKEHYSDGWQLYRGLIWHWHHKQLVPSYSFDTENTQWLPPGLQQFGPQGGLRGWTVGFTVSLHDHYDEEETTV